MVETLLVVEVNADGQLPGCLPHLIGQSADGSKPCCIFFSGDEQSGCGQGRKSGIDFADVGRAEVVVIGIGEVSHLGSSAIDLSDKRFWVGDACDKQDAGVCTDAVQYPGVTAEYRFKVLICHP